MTETDKKSNKSLRAANRSASSSKQRRSSARRSSTSGGTTGRRPTTSSSKRRRQRQRAPFDADSEDERMRKQLDERFNVKRRSKTNGDETERCTLRQASNGFYGITNGERHDGIVRRAENAHLSRFNKASEISDCVQTRWRCGLCQLRPSRSVLGDLFGPYYIRVAGRNWPSFLAKKPAHLEPEAEYVFDIWLHGMCALTAPDIQMYDTQLPALEAKIITFWKQHCAACFKEGAAVEYKGKLMHYPCAIYKGYRLDIPMEQIIGDSEDNAI